MPETPDPLDWSDRVGHVVVCGLHDDGLRLVEQLQVAGVPSLVVDDQPDVRLTPLLATLGVDFLAADARRPEVLAMAGIAAATAVVCAESDDLRTLATALLARELRPEVRVVVALRNAAVGRALSDIGVIVLDAAGLAAPSIVEACLRTAVHRVRLDDDDFLVVEVESPRDATLRELYGDVAPLALVRAATEGTPSRLVVSPGRDEQVRTQDRVVLVGTNAELTAAGLVRQPARRPQAQFIGARAPRAPTKRPTNIVLFALRSLDRRIKLAVSALFGLTLVSVTVLTLGYRDADGTRMSVLDALYFTVETIGTVGFGDFYFRDQHSWLRVWAIVLMLTGATLATLFFALLTNLLISRTIAASLGRRRVTGLSGHVIVSGVGAVGVAVVEELRKRDIDVVVVEADDQNRFLGQLRALHVPVVIADGTITETWSAVGLDQARAVATLTSDDLVNIETGLAVRDLLGDRWFDVPVVLRVFDRRLADTVAGSFDFRHVRSPSALAAPWFVGAALGLDVLQTLYVAGLPMLVARLTVEHSLVGTPMQELPARLRVVRLQRANGGSVDLPRRDEVLGAGDLVTIIGPYEELLRLLRDERKPPEVPQGMLR